MRRPVTYVKLSPGARPMAVSLDCQRGRVVEGRYVGMETLSVDVHPTRVPRLLARVIGRALEDDGYTRARSS